MSCPPRFVKPAVVELLEERGEAGRNDGIEDDVGAAGHDLLDRLAIVHVIERKVFLADDLAAVGRDELAHLLVHHVRPDVVGRRQVEFLRAGLLHQPGNERIELLRRHRAGAEDQRVAFLALVLLRVDVELPALHDGRAFDGLPRGAVDAAEEHVDLVVLDELGRLGFRDAVDGRAVFEEELELPPEQAAAGVDVVDHHLRHIGIGDAHERKRPVCSAMTPTLMDAWFMASSCLAMRPADLPGPMREDAASAPPAHGWIPYAADIPRCCTRPRSARKRAAPARVVTPIFE